MKYIRLPELIDEWLLTELNQEDSIHVLEISEARLNHSSTIFCSQFSPEACYQKIGNVQLADAILGRVVHNYYKFLINGEFSMRERHGLGDL